MSTDAAASTSESAPDSSDDSTDGGVLGDRDLREYLQGGALAVAVLFALISAVGFYTSARRAIDVWVATPYQPAFDAGFNLVVLLVALAVASRLVDRLE